MQLASLLLAMLAVQPSDIPNPRARSAWVTDLAEVIPADTEARIDARLDALERELRVEIAVVTVPDSETTPKDLATALFNHWGIGKKDANNGLLVLLVVGQRRLEMETGYGLEGLLPDGWLGAMQREHMVPALKAGDYGAAFEQGLQAIDARLRAGPDEAREGTHDAPADAPSTYAKPAALVATPLLLLIPLTAFIKRRRRTCPSCKVLMPKLDESADDAHLAPGQKREEQLGSVDYEVLVCASCGFTKTIAHSRWFSRYARCHKCSYRTMLSNSTTLVSATYDHGGSVRVNESCVHCGMQRSYTRSTPRLTRSSSSSGRSSGGSFGGGRSGGGGAGSSF